MADYAFEAAQDEQRRRRTQPVQRARPSYFPAVNQSIANFNRLSASKVLGYEPDPELTNKAIAASIARTGLQSATRTVQLPSGGSVDIPVGSKIPQEYQGFQQQFKNRLAEATQTGFGETPIVHSSTQTVGFGGVETPFTQLSPAQRSQFGVQTRGQQFGENMLGSVANLFGYSPTSLAAKALGTLSGNALSSLARFFNPRTTPAVAQYPQTRPPQYPRRYTDYF